MPIDPKFVDHIAKTITDDPDVLKDVVEEDDIKQHISNNGMLSESMGSYGHQCRNKVYRRGTVMKCNRACAATFCEGCSKALRVQSLHVHGLYEARKEPSNKPDDLEVEDSFEVHDDYDEDKKEPGEPGKQKRKSSLQDGPEGEKGSKKSPYLKEARIGEIVTGHGRDPGPRKMDPAQAEELGLPDEYQLGSGWPKKRPYARGLDSDKPGSRSQCGKCDLGLEGQDAIDHGLCRKCDSFRRGTNFPAEPRRGDLSRRKRGLS